MSLGCGHLPREAVKDHQTRHLVESSHDGALTWHSWLSQGRGDCRPCRPACDPVSCDLGRFLGGVLAEQASGDCCVLLLDLSRAECRLLMVRAGRMGEVKGRA